MLFKIKRTFVQFATVLTGQQCNFRGEDGDKVGIFLFSGPQGTCYNHDVLGEPFY